MTRELMGLELHRDERVYDPAEDSLLLAHNVEPPERGPALDVGTGTGLVALRLAGEGARTVATDANPVACRLARRNARANDRPVRPVCTDLADGLSARFTAVACNPPYLPVGEEGSIAGPIGRALGSGEDGAALTRRLLARLPGLLAEEARAWLIVSSRQPVDELRERARGAGLTWRTGERLSVGRFEQLQVVELRRAD